MKDKLKKLLDPDISKKEEDQIFEEVLKKKLDEDLKMKWQGMLNSDHGIVRNETSTKKKVSSSNYIKIFLAAAACISLLIALQVFYTAPSDPYTMAQQYLNKQEILHPGASKGIVDEDENRTLAIQAFNNKDYEQSTKYYQNLEAANEEDMYYHGLALLLNNRYSEAIRKFEENGIKSDRFKQEIHWYRSLAYLLNKQNEKAETLLKQIGSNEWNYQQAQQLLKQLDEK